MQFHEMGNAAAPTLLIMHGMLQRYDPDMPLYRLLAARYRLILPVQDGLYPGSGDFTCFADQARQVEDYVQAQHGGHLRGAYGASQGGLMLTELMTRGNIAIDEVITDGAYVAHQGRAAAWLGVCVFRLMQRRGGKPPRIMDAVMPRMGLTREDYAMLDQMYWAASRETVRRNLMENYTYRVRPALADWPGMVHLWCGGKEPYALKSHREMKRYLRRYEERVFPGLGHGQMLLREPARLAGMIAEVLG